MVQRLCSELQRCHRVGSSSADAARDASALILVLGAQHPQKPLVFLILSSID